MGIGRYTMAPAQDEVDRRVTAIVPNHRPMIGLKGGEWQDFQCGTTGICGKISGHNSTGSCMFGPNSSAGNKAHVACSTYCKALEFGVMSKGSAFSPVPYEDSLLFKYHTQPGPKLARLCSLSVHLADKW